MTSTKTAQTHWTARITIGDTSWLEIPAHSIVLVTARFIDAKGNTEVHLCPEGSMDGGKGIPIPGFCAPEGSITLYGPDHVMTILVACPFPYLRMHMVSHTGSGAAPIVELQYHWNGCGKD